MKANSEIEIHNFTHINSIKIENKNSILLNNETNQKSVLRNQFNPNSLCFWMLSRAGVTCVKKTFEKSAGKITPPTIRVKKSSLKIDFSFHFMLWKREHIDTGDLQVQQTFWLMAQILQCYERVAPGGDASFLFITWHPDHWSLRIQCLHCIIQWSSLGHD